MKQKCHGARLYFKLMLNILKVTRVLPLFIPIKNLLGLYCCFKLIRTCIIILDLIRTKKRFELCYWKEDLKI
jgi:hypothetical protein